MTKQVVVTVATKVAVFPAATVDTTYVFTIGDATGAVLLTQETSDAHATFDAVAAGDYTASVTKNGVSASAQFSVPEDTVSLSVPDVVTVTLA